MGNRLNELFMDEYNKRANIIHSVAMEIQMYINYRKINNFDNDSFKYIYYRSIEVISNWVGYTCVGEKKHEIIRNAFQHFFQMFYRLLLFFKDESNEPIEKEFAIKGLYQGKLYRYLGTSLKSRKKSKIIVEYNDIYVSWTKKEHVDYLQSKLHSNYIIISCEIKEPYYGIDLHNLGIGREFEQEVVFPTIKELICN